MIDIDISAEDEQEDRDCDEIFEIFDEDEEVEAVEIAIYIYISLWLCALRGWVCLNLRFEFVGGSQVPGEGGPMPPDELCEARARVRAFSRW